LPFARPETLQTLPQPFPRQLSQLHPAGICFFGRSSQLFAPSQTLPTLPKAFPRQISQLHAAGICFSGRSSLPFACPQTLPTLPQASTATLAATRCRHLFFRAFKPAVCPLSNPPNPPPHDFPRQLSHTPLASVLRAFKLAVCPPSNPSNPPAGLSQQLSQLHAAAICFLVRSSLPFARPQTLPTLPQAVPRQLSQLLALAVYF